MTEQRRDELLAKVVQISVNDLCAFDGTESDIRMTQDSENGDIFIDLTAHFMQSDEEQPDLMNVHYAAAKCTIKNASVEYQDKSCQLLKNIIQSTLKTVKLAGGDQERAQVQQRLEEKGRKKLLSFIQRREEQFNWSDVD